MDQMDIDWGSLPSDAADGFLAFHKENPWVYAEIVSMARNAKARGRKALGMAMIFEVLRWNRAMSTMGDEPFKLNNNYKAYYTRLIEHRCPDLRDFFTKRVSQADIVDVDSAA